MMSYMDKQGIAYLEPGAIYTIESAASEIARMSAFGEVREKCSILIEIQDPRLSSDAGEKSYFMKSGISRSPSGNIFKRMSMSIGILPKTNAEIRSPLKFQTENVNISNQLIF